MFKYLLIFIFFSQVILINAQKKPFDITNAREGENIEYCHQHIKLMESMKDPAFVLIKEQDDLEFEQLLKEGSVPKAIVYKIPVVFHILHNNGVENITHEQIVNGLFILNRDFRLLNADAANVHAEFQGMPADIEVEFVLATKAPDGTCFNGTTRTMSPLSYDGSSGSAQVTAIKNGNNVYQGSWPGNKYLNVFVCGEIGGAAGYTTNPSFASATSMTNGIWLLHNYLGSIGTSSSGSSRTLTHEVGHWLNLSHTWGSNNNPGNATSCSTDDNVTDTPNCIGVQACVMSSNTCNSDNAYWGFDIRDNVENYLDYSYCSKMFTEGQKTRMRTALQSNNTGRANLWSASNLTATGATGVLTLCAADFNADRTTICTGESVVFTDASFNIVSGRTWTFTGGSPSTSTSSNPTVTYSQPGMYAVTLSATDGTTTDVETKTNYIRVLPTAVTLPFWEGFEPYTSLANLPNWEIYNPNNNNAFVLETTTAYTGSKCAKLVNFGQAPSNVDELISAPIDLSVIPANGIVTLSFRYAYRKKTSGDYEYLKVFISSDCGENWAQRKTLGGNQLSTLFTANSWAPASNADWVTIHVTNVTNNYFSQDFKIKFRFEGEGGNNFYLDDINLYSGASSNEIVLGLNEFNESINDISLYPNPTDGELNVSFSASKNKNMQFQVMDITGKIIQNNQVNAVQGSNLVLLDTRVFAAGSYFLKIMSDDHFKTLPFVIK